MATDKNKRRRRDTEKSSEPKVPQNVDTSSITYSFRVPGWIKDEKFLALLLFVLAFLTYLVSINNEFVWDDVEVIQKTYFRFDRSGFFSDFIPSLIGEKKLLYFRPVLSQSYIIDWKLWKLNPLGFHLTNIILYSFTVAAFYFASLQVSRLYSIKRQHFFTLTASLLFLYHPMHVESVSWVSGRTDILCGLFFIMAFGFHILSYHRKYIVIFTVIALALSLFSKEVAVAFPFLVLGFDLLNKRFIRKQNIIKYLLYMGTLLFYVYLRSRAFVSIPAVYNAEIANAAHSPGDIMYFFNILKVLVVTYSYYLKQLVFPFTFNAFVTSLPDGVFYWTASIVIVLNVVISALYCLKRMENIVVFNIYWVLLTIGPSSLIAVFAFIATPVSERYLFIPSAGYCLLLSYLLLTVSQRRISQRAGLIITSLIIFSFMFFCISRQSVWDNRVSLWKDSSEKSYTHAIPHINYGMALLDAGKTEEAINEFHISLNPDFENTPSGRAIAANNLGVAYINKKDYTNAAKSLLIALKSDPSFYKTYYHFGLLYFIKANSTGSRDDYLSSEKYLLQAVSLYNNYGKALLLLAKVHFQIGDSEKSHYYARKALNSGLVDELALQAREILKK